MNQTKWRLLLCLYAFALSSLLFHKRSFGFFDIEHFHIAPGTGKIITTDLGSIGPHLELTSQLFLNYTYQPLRSIEGQFGPHVDHRLSMDLSLSFAMFKRFQIALSLPITWFQAGQISGSQELAAIGPGDARLHLKGIFFENESSRFYERSKIGFGLGLVGILSLPTGDSFNFLSTQSAIPLIVISNGTDTFPVIGIGRGLPTFQLKLAAHLQYKFFRAALNFGGFFAFPDIGYGSTSYMGHGFVYNLGGEFAIAETRTWNLSLLAEVFGLSREPFEASSSPIEGILASKLSFQKWTLFLGMGAGFSYRGYGTPAARVFAGFSYAFIIPKKSSSQRPDPIPFQKTNSYITLTPQMIELRQKTFLEFDNDKIRPTDYPILDEIASLLQSRPDIKKVLIAGHTDDQGAGSYNLDLSKRRAKSVKEYLVGKGVSSDRLLTEGFGETCPLIPNDTDDQRSQNRRVDFVILEQAGQVSIPYPCLTKRN